MCAALIAARTVFVSLENVVATVDGPEIFVINCLVICDVPNTDNVKTALAFVHKDGTGVIAHYVSINTAKYLR